jgi:hypothetical protein
MSQAIFFYHTTKVGLGIGVKWGRGFLLVRTNGRDESPATFSPPVFYKLVEGSLGLTAGLSVCLSRFLAQFRAGCTARDLIAGISSCSSLPHWPEVLEQAPIPAFLFKCWTGG